PAGGCDRRDARDGAARDPHGLSRRADPVGDRRTARLAAGHRQDQDETGPAPSPRGPRRYPRTRARTLANAGRGGRMIDHTDVREQLEIAAVEPGGLDRVMAGDTPDAIALASHLAGCSSCLEELGRLRETSGILRDVIATEPPAELRDRTLAFVRDVGVPRGPRLGTPPLLSPVRFAPDSDDAARAVAAPTSSAGAEDRSEPI